VGVSTDTCVKEMALKGSTVTERCRTRKLCARENVACVYAWLGEGGGVYIMSPRNAVIGLDCALK